MSINPGKYKKYQDRKAWPHELLARRYKAEDCGMGEKRAITIELKRRNNKFIRTPPQQRASAVQYMLLSGRNYQTILAITRTKLEILHKTADEKEAGNIRFFLEQMRIIERELGIFLNESTSFHKSFRASIDETGVN